ncbi:MAG: oxygen-independent coproporphyrinogen III oxidase [Pseudomonadota bacterium]
MMDYDTLKARGLFEERLPRYTSYPPAPAFHTGVGADFQAHALQKLPRDQPVSVYLHIPFCQRLCWFCACRTQGVRSLSPVDAYIDTLEAELQIVSHLLPGRLPLGQMHWGGGTPTILPGGLVKRLTDALQQVFYMSEDTEFSVEIDPTLIDTDKVTALSAAGMTRASIGVQDFEPKVQDCIGRQQSFDQTSQAVEMLRVAGIGSLNIDLVYGLPHQTLAGFERTLQQVNALKPDRVALFGYAHVPHMAKRQLLIPEAALPDDRGRFSLFRKATEAFEKDGMISIGIDHFARPSDSMARAAANGLLRRNFQGYTVDSAPSLLGLGASSISRFTEGFVQNTPQTGAYTKAIRAGHLPGVRGYALTDEDRLRSRIIEMLMCDFAIDLDELALTPAQEKMLGPCFDALKMECGDMLQHTGGMLVMAARARPLVRRLAHLFDTFNGLNAGYSRVS